MSVSHSTIYIQPKQSMYYWNQTTDKIVLVFVNTYILVYYTYNELTETKLIHHTNVYLGWESNPQPKQQPATSWASQRLRELCVGAINYSSLFTWPYRCYSLAHMSWHLYPGLPPAVCEGGHPPHRIEQAGTELELVQYSWLAIKIRKRGFNKKLYWYFMISG